MFDRGPIVYLVVAPSLAVVARACLFVIGRLVIPEQPVAGRAPWRCQGGLACQTLTPKDGSR